MNARRGGPQGERSESSRGVSHLDSRLRGNDGNSHYPGCGRYSRGFTLLEILVAIAILALAMLATVKAASSYAANQAYLQERTLAQWVARNRLVEYQLEDNWPNTGRQKDEVDFAGLEWVWLSEVKPTPDSDIRRIDIRVWMAGADIDAEEPLASLSGFMGRRE